MTISPDEFYTLAEAARLVQMDRRALLGILKKNQYIEAGAGKRKRYLLKGKYLLQHVKEKVMHSVYT